MVKELAIKKVTSTLDEVLKRTDQIAEASIDLGIPLEDCICAVVRKTLKNLEVNPEQLDLFDSSTQKKGRHE